MRPMSAEQFLAEPAGGYVVGNSWLAWAAAPDLCGTVFWGRPSESDLQTLTRLWEFDQALVRGYDGVTDVSRLEALDGAAFQVLVDYVRRRLDWYDRAVRRHAVIYPTGVMGAAVAGVYPLVEPRHTWRVFAEAARAFEWLERPAALLAEIEGLVDQARGLSPVVRLLRQHLSTHLAEATIASAARALSLSQRTLQRELQNASTSFRNEIDRARLSEARRRLIETDDKIDRVAAAVGLASGVQLVALFRRLGEPTPSEVRAAGRG